MDVTQELRDGKLLLNANQFAEAEEVFSRCCAEEPENSEAWFSFGVARHRLEKVEAALLAFDQAIRFDPLNIPAYNAKASMLTSLERDHEALEVVQQTLKLEPNNTKTLTNYGTLLFQLHHYPQAKMAFDRALALDRFIPSALQYRSMVLTKLGRSEEALVDAKLLSRLLPVAMPKILEASAHLAGSRYKEALAAANEATERDSESISAIVLTAMAQAAMGLFEDAVQSFSQAEALDAKSLGEVLAQQIINLPSGMQSDPLLLYLTLANRRLHACNWQNRDEYLMALQNYLLNADRIKASEADIMLLHAVCNSPVDPLLRLELAKYVALDVSMGLTSYAHRDKNMPPQLKIGYLAKSFNEDSGIKNTAGIFQLHNRSDFEIYCYSLEPADNSEFNQNIKKHCDHFVELFPMLNYEAAGKINQDGIHILVDLDGLHREYPYELLAHQPAHLQVGFGGIPVSTGARYMQYRITDHRVTPAGSEAQWTEKLVRLPDTHLVYDIPAFIDSQRITRKEAGLPESGTVFCCFSEPDLIEPEIFKTWMEILQRVKDSVLWLSRYSIDMRRNLRNAAYGHGINPTRLIFSPPMERGEQAMAYYRLADLFLDTYMLNDYQTTSDALWTGLPVVTLFGETMGTRMTASKLSALEFTNLICADMEEYKERACHLATHPEYLAILKRKLERHVLTKPLFNTQSTVLHLEEAYREIWRRYLRGETLSDFSVVKEE